MIGHIAKYRAIHKEYRKAYFMSQYHRLVFLNSIMVFYFLFIQIVGYLGIYKDSSTVGSLSKFVSMISVVMLLLVLIGYRFIKSDIKYALADWLVLVNAMIYISWISICVYRVGVEQERFSYIIWIMVYVVAVFILRLSGMMFLFLYAYSLAVLMIPVGILISQNYIEFDKPTVSNLVVLWFLISFTSFINYQNSVNAYVRTTEAERLKNELEKKNEDQKLFFSKLTHELRTPMNGVLGFLSLIQESDSIEQIKQYASIAMFSGQATVHMVNDILDYSKMEAQKLSIVDGRYNIRELVNQCVATFAMRSKERGVEVRGAFEGITETFLVGDETRIRQIIMNLMSNASKYTREGSIVLAVSTVKSEKGLDLVVSVKDTGIGMSKESIEVLFQPYSRFDEDKNKGIQGTGLGLSIVKNLVELMHGSIKVESEVGKGSEFVVTLPQGCVECRPEFAMEQQKQVAVNKKILYVDDVSINSMLFGRLLGTIKGSKIDLVTEADPIKAWDIIKEQKFDMIFIDYMMPVMNGIELAEKIKAEDNVNKDAILIACSATDDSADIERFMKTGFKGVLEKPIPRPQLLELLTKKYDN